MQSRTLYILPQDRQIAIDRIAELEREILDMGSEFHVALNQSSESWHDNAPFDALRERQSVLQAEIQNLKSVIYNAAPSLPKVVKNRVGVGATVTAENTKLNKRTSYFIAGDWTARAGDKSKEALIVSAKSPIGHVLVGCRVGDEVSFRGSLLIVREIVYEALAT